MSTSILIAQLTKVLNEMTWKTINTQISIMHSNACDMRSVWGDNGWLRTRDSGHRYLLLRPNQHQMDFDEDKDGDFHDRALQGGCRWFCSSWIWSEMRCMSSYAVYGLMSNIKRPTRSQHLVVNRSQTQRLCRTNLLSRKPRRAVVLLRVTRLLFQRFLIGFTLLLLYSC